MKKTTLVLGLALLIISPSCFGSDETAPPKATEPVERYKMFSPQVSSSGITEIYVIDTQTGRVWRQNFFNDIKGFYLVPQPYLSADHQTASVTPPESKALESLTLQNQLDRDLDKARQKSTESKTTPPSSPQLP